MYLIQDANTNLIALLVRPGGWAFSTMLPQCLQLTEFTLILDDPKIKLWKTIAAEQKRVSMPNWTRRKGKSLFPGASHVTDLEVSMIKTVVLRSPRRVIRVVLIPPFSPDESIFPIFTLRSKLNSYSMQGFKQLAGRKKII